MKILSADEVARLSPYRDIVEALRLGFRSEIETPVRHQHQIADASTLLLMPAWSKDWAGLKTVVFKPDNRRRASPPFRRAICSSTRRPARPSP